MVGPLCGPGDFVASLVPHRNFIKPYKPFRLSEARPEPQVLLVAIIGLAVGFRSTVGVKLVS